MVKMKRTGIIIEAIIIKDLTIEDVSLVVVGESTTSEVVGEEHQVTSELIESIGGRWLK